MTDLIEDLDLTVRTYNCLKREGITSLQDIAECTEDILLSFRNLGQRGVDECKVKLAERGLRLRNSAPPMAEWEKDLIGTAIEVENVTIYRCGNLSVTVNGDRSATISQTGFSRWELEALCRIFEQIKSEAKE